MKNAIMTNKQKEEIIAYGLHRIKVMIICVLIIFVMGVFLKIIPQSIIYMVALIFLRKYAGGYHASSEKKCFVISFFMVLSGLIVLKIMGKENLWVLMILAMISSGIIWKFSPIDNKNKRLSVQEMRVYKKVTRVMLILELMTLGYAYFYSFWWLVGGIAIAMITVGTVVILGHLQNKVTNKNFIEE